MFLIKPWTSEEIAAHDFFQKLRNFSCEIEGYFISTKLSLDKPLIKHVCSSLSNIYERRILSTKSIVVWSFSCGIVRLSAILFIGVAVVFK